MTTSGLLAPQDDRESKGGPSIAPGPHGIRLVALVLILLGASCRAGPTLSYKVVLLDTSPRKIAVELVIDRAPASSLTLKAYGTTQVLGISDFTATGPSGEVLQFEPNFETVVIRKQTVEVPRFLIRGPLPSELKVTYRVQPGQREGDGHMGYTGRCYGHAGEDFALVTGRNLFLLPQPAESIEGIRVNFVLPERWSAKVPWTARNGAWEVGIGGQFAAEHLISAAIGLGNFRERALKLGNTNLRLTFEASIPGEEEERAAARIQQAAQYVRSLFGRDLGPDYLTVIAPKAPEGDDIAGEGWATGQGATLVPLTPTRLKLFAERLIDAYVRHAPYRTEVQSAEELWLVDSVRERYSWLAVSTAGLVTRENLDRTLAVSYVNALQVHGLDMNLERAYSTSEVGAVTREVLAPFALMLVERELLDTTRGQSRLEALMPQLFRTRSAKSLWSVLPAVGTGNWDDFRHRFVRNTDVAPAWKFYSLAPTQPAPDHAADTVVRELTLAYTGLTTAYLENCGCKTNQSGGVARRAMALDRLRAEDRAVVLLDAGSTFLLPKNNEKLDFLSLQEQKIYLKSMELMRYDAAAVGTTELIHGLEHFRELTQGVSVPYLAANVRHSGNLVAAPSIQRVVDGLRVAIIGIFDPPVGSQASQLLEDNLVDVEVEDPLETLQRELPRLARQADLVIVIGRLAPHTIRRIAANRREVDIIISSEFHAPGSPGGNVGGHDHGQDSSGFLGTCLVLYTKMTNYGFSTARLGIDRAGRVAAASIKQHELTESIPDSPRIRHLLNAFYDRIGRLPEAQEAVAPLFSDDEIRRRGRYVGAAMCASCHESQHRQWSTTTHATAFKTLLDRHRHFQPKCVSCHVVGYGTPHGYRLGMPEQTLANVQCEVCHGPGETHVRNPTSVNIQRLVPEKVCLQCHDPEHSDHFVYLERLPKVKHDHVQ